MKLIIDLPGILYPIFYSTVHASGIEAGCTQAVMTLTKILNQHGVNIVETVLAVDAKPYKRQEFDPNYKAHRAAAPPELRAFLTQVTERIVHSGFKVVYCKGYEADDIIFTLASGKDVLVVSVDKDLQALEPPAQLFGVDGQPIAPVVKPELVPVYLALVGDRSDNIPGIPGIGPKRALALLAPHESKDAALKALTVDQELLRKSLLLTELMQVPLDKIKTLEVKHKPVEKEKAPEQPGNFSTEWFLAQKLASSGLFPLNPEQAFAIILKGAEYGIAPVSALMGMPVLKGKISMNAQTIIGICLRSGHCEYFTVVESSEEQCTWITKRKGAPDPVSRTWTQQDSFRAGLGGDTHRRYPAQMLRWRCGVDLARTVYPDMVGGLYSPEELSDV
jgi:5'-3' exonuclease